MSAGLPHSVATGPAQPLSRLDTEPRLLAKCPEGRASTAFSGHVLRAAEYSARVVLILFHEVCGKLLSFAVRQSTSDSCGPECLPVRMCSGSVMFDLLSLVPGSSCAVCFASRLPPKRARCSCKALLTCSKWTGGSRGLLFNNCAGKSVLICCNS